MTRTIKIIEQAEQLCIANGARLTVKRRQVLTGLLQSDKALSAYELIDFCEGLFQETFSAMSMYRILDFLEQQHLAHRLNLANKYVACAHIDCQHTHDTPQFLICQTCHKVSEICVSEDAMLALKQNANDAGFKLATPQIEMSCVCRACEVNKS